MSSLAIIGAGPRGTGLLERIAANAAELLPADHRLHIHLVDPFPPGAGRIWRYEQSPLLRMNSMAEDVTMFTDHTSTVEGPVRPGPSLAEWASRMPEFAPYQPPSDPGLRAELGALAATDFPTRRAQSAYLDWVLRRALADLPDRITVTVHRDTAVALEGAPDGPQTVRLASGAAPLTVDRVVLTLGHLGSRPDEQHTATAEFAARHGRFHLPPAFSSEADLSGIAPGEQLVMRGFGLAFVDLTALLTEGRGGRFETQGTQLVYRPSGREPVIHVGSRRGVPYHSKTGYRLQGPPAALPRYFGPAAVEQLLARPGRIELRRDAWPLMAKEIGFGYYHELFHAHPERTAVRWPDFLADYDRLDWYAPELATIVAGAVPDPADRLDFERLDRPLAGLRFDSSEELQRHLRGYIRQDADRRADPAHSADLGAFLALLSLYGQLPRLLAAGRLSAHSTGRELDGWWQGFFSFLASGPPGFRLRELLALAEAGVVRFLGADLTIENDEATGTFLATSPSVPGHRVAATALIEAYLPHHALERTEDPLLAALHRSGELSEEVVADPGHVHRSGLLAVDPEDGAVVDPSLGGAPHPRRTALGPHTNGRSFAAFARPRTNAPAFRQNDATARALLSALSAAFERGDRMEAGLTTARS